LEHDLFRKPVPTFRDHAHEAGGTIYAPSGAPRDAVQAKFDANVSKRRTRAVWREWVCGENNQPVVIGKDNYFLSADGLLMPARKGQAPPDLKYFNRARK
jgi:hypothetical protein